MSEYVVLLEFAVLQYHAIQYLEYNSATQPGASTFKYWSTEYLYSVVLYSATYATRLVLKETYSE